MRSDLHVKISMDLLSAIVFMQPCRSQFLFLLKVLVFRYMSGTLLLFILWLMSNQLMKPVTAFCKFVITKYLLI